MSITPLEGVTVILLLVGGIIVVFLGASLYHRIDIAFASLSAWLLLWIIFFLWDFTHVLKRIHRDLQETIDLERRFFEALLGDEITADLGQIRHESRGLVQRFRQIYREIAGTVDEK